LQDTYRKLAADCEVRPGEHGGSAALTVSVSPTVTPEAFALRRTRVHGEVRKPVHGEAGEVERGWRGGDRHCTN